MTGFIKFLVIATLSLSLFTPFLCLRLKHRSNQEKEKKSYPSISGEIKTGDFLMDVLTRQGADRFCAHNILEELKKVYDVKRCHAGDTWKIFFSKNGRISQFIYQSDPVEYFVVYFHEEAGRYYALRKKIEGEKKIVGATGRINSSLYESMCACGVPPELVLDFAEVFASQIDFFSDCQTGDHFSLLWESYQAEGKILKHLDLVAGVYQKGTISYQAFRFQNHFYDEKGRSLETSFLKAPLSYRRISSFFSPARLHPVTGIYRPHLGVDYVAPLGTPVSAIGDGKIVFQSWTANGYGKAIKIEHPGGYISYYGHLSNFRKGSGVGRKVKKGEVIGYVGSTGSSTGPHLDFRLKKNGKFVDPLKLKMLPVRPLPKASWQEFQKIKEKLSRQLTQLSEKDYESH